MASVNSITAQRLFPPLTKPIKHSPQQPRLNFQIKGLSGSSLQSLKLQNSTSSRRNCRDWHIGSTAEELDVIPVQSSDPTDQQDGGVPLIDRESEGENVNQVGGFVNEKRFSLEGAGEFNGFSSSSSSGLPDGNGSQEENMEKLIDRTINAAIV